MKKHLLLIVIAIFFGCSDSDNGNFLPPTNQVNIRLMNHSNYDFKKVRANTSTDDLNFGNLDHGQASAYRQVDTAYAYAYVEVTIDGRVYTYMPIDYVGETPLESGYYTYRVDANSSTDQYQKLSLTFVKDR